MLGTTRGGARPRRCRQSGPVPRCGSLAAVSARPVEAADGNRTRIIALEGRGSTVELPPHARSRPDGPFADDDSLHKRRRIWRSRRGRPARGGRAGPSRCRSSSIRDGRTRGRAGGLSAIDARSIAKESHEVCGALCRDRSLAAERVCDVALAMRRIVFVLVVGPTRSAVVVALFASLPAPGEVREWLCLSAAAAGSRRLGTSGHEHMFSTSPDGGATCCVDIESSEATGSGAVW